MARKANYPCRLNVSVPEWIALAFEDMARRSHLDVADIARAALFNGATSQGYREPTPPPVMNGHHQEAAE